MKITDIEIIPDLPEDRRAECRSENPLHQSEPSYHLQDHDGQRHRRLRRRALRGPRQVHRRARCRTRSLRLHQRQSEFRPDGRAVRRHGQAPRDSRVQTHGPEDPRPCARGGVDPPRVPGRPGKRRPAGGWRRIYDLQDPYLRLLRRFRTDPGRGRGGAAGIQDALRLQSQPAACRRPANPERTGRFTRGGNDRGPPRSVRRGRVAAAAAEDQLSRFSCTSRNSAAGRR